MTTIDCHDPVDLDTLAAYWLGELADDRAASFEEHYLGCARCARRLESFVALAEGVRAAVRDGKVGLVVSAPFVVAMQRAGMHVREYRLGPGDSVNCTIGPGDDAVISRLRAPLAGVGRLDLVSSIDEDDRQPSRMTDVPFDAGLGEVLMIPSAAWLKAMPAFTMRLRLVAVDGDVERPVGDYTFNHSPS